MFSIIFHAIVISVLLSQLPSLDGDNFNFPPIPSGVTYSRLADNLPNPEEALDLAWKNGIRKIRLYTPHHDVLNTLDHASTFEVTIGVPNKDIINLGFTKNFAIDWVKTYVKAHRPDVDIKMIVVGHNISPGDRLAGAILPAMEALKYALNKDNDPDLYPIYVTTSFQLTWLCRSFPPSLGTFDPNWDSTIEPILDFLEHNSPILLCDLYPYDVYMTDRVYRNISLDYALLSSTDVIVQDGDMGYTNMLDALIDAFFSAMEKFDVTNVKIIVGETGWPISSTMASADIQTSETYIANVIRRLKVAAKTPKRPGWPVQIFIYNLFLQSKAPGEKKNLGLFYPDNRPIYNLNMSTS